MTLEKTTFAGFNSDVLKHDSYKRLMKCMKRHTCITMGLPADNPEMGDLTNTERIAEILYHKLVDEFSMDEKQQCFFKNHLLVNYSNVVTGGDTNVSR